MTAPTTTAAAPGRHSGVPRPVELGEGALAYFRLAERAGELEGSEEYRRTGIAGATLVRGGDATVVLVALRAGAAMREHRAPSAASVVVLAGRIAFVPGDGRAATELGAGSLAVFAADVLHAVEAREDARYLVVIGGRSRAGEPRDGAMDAITALLQDDHVRLDAGLAEAKRALGSGDAAGALACFRAFRDGLERHIVAEEEVLFPAFEALTGAGGGGPTAVMRHEHREIQRLLAAVDAAIAGATRDEATRRLGELTAILRGHNGKEERILYPMSDEAARREGTHGALVERVRERLDARDA